MASPAPHPVNSTPRALGLPSPGVRPVFPFSALVGQEEMKLALILNAISPAVGGVLVRGEKGTGKSTAVRALAALLPEIEVVDGCPFSCDPRDPSHWCGDCARRAARQGSLPRRRRRVGVVELPLNASEEMLIGGLDFGRAVKSGRRVLQAGLLARAHRGFLYVDEVNLLDDHLVDVVLDAAASGWNRLEREGMSFSHPARFVLVGTMNPEEGELRPQFLDRFGLCVEVHGEQEVDRRVTLMELREAFDADPAGFMARHAADQQEIARAIQQARELLPSVRLSGRVRGFIAALCRENHVAGHRADLVMEWAARALAAYRGLLEVGEAQVREVAPLALRHRRRDPLPPPPPPPPPPPQDSQEDSPQDQAQQPPTPDQSLGGEDGEGFELPLPPPPSQQDPRDEDDPLERVFEVGATFRVRRLATPKDRKLRRGSGRRSLTRTAQKQGRYVRSIMQENTSDLALDATLRAAAPYQLRRRGRSRLKVCIERQDLRGKVREKRVGNFLVFVVDASGSMGARSRMVATKGAVLSLLLDAYQKRDRVCLVAFRGRQAELLLPPTSSVESAARLLRELPVGGRTPLAAGLEEARRQVEIYLRKEPAGRPLVILITDGKGNVGLGGELLPHEQALVLAERMAQDERVRFVVVDTEAQGVLRLGLASRLAAALGAELFQLEDLKAQDLVAIAKRSN